MASGAAPYLGLPLESPPQDGISRLRFSTNSDLLLVSSWDRTLRLYDAPSKVLKASIAQQAPLLDCSFQDHDGAAFIGTLDGTIKLVNLSSGESMVIGSHHKAVQSLEYLKQRGLLASGSWDGSMRLWDPRLPPQANCTAVISLPGKVYCMSSAADKLLVATSGRHIAIFDVRRLDTRQPEQVRESSLKYQTRCVAAFPEGRGYAVSSVEGRVAMEYYEEADQAGKYAFKCHRRAENGGDVVYPVHAIAFHPGYGTFATGGGDGMVYTWDGANRKRLAQSARYPTSVAALAFSRDGSMLAVASSYAYEQGEREHPADQVYIRAVQDAEVRPKVKK